MSFSDFSSRNLTKMTELITSTITPTTSDPNGGQYLLIIVGSIGGVIIIASIVIIIVVAVFVRRSTRELKQQTRSSQNRPQGQRPAHANSVRLAQGQARATSIRVEPEAQPYRKDADREEEKGKDEIQGFYALIPRSEDLAASAEEQEDSGEKGIVYAALEFDDTTEIQRKAGKASEEGSNRRPLTGPCVAVPQSQPDTYVEMEPLVAKVRNDSVEFCPTGGIYELARDPGVDVQASSGGFSSGPVNVGAGKNNETLLLTLV